MIQITTPVLLALLVAAAPVPAQEPVWVEVGQLYGSDIDADDHFGETMDLDGSTLVVGAFRKNFETGAVYVFERSPDVPFEWLETNKLEAYPGDDLFGLSVEVSGDFISVGAQSIGNDGTTTLYHRDTGGPGAWGQVAHIVREDGGVTMIEGDLMAFSNSRLDVDGQNEAGGVVLLERGPGGPADWEIVQPITASDAEATDHFGRTVARSGDLMVIGAPEVADLGRDSGAAYAFERDETGIWTEVAKLYRSDGDEHDNFGAAVGLDGRTAVISGQTDRNDEAPFIFERLENGTWQEWLKLFPIDPDENLVEEVGIAGDVVVAQATGHVGENSAGAAHVFERHEGGVEAWGGVAVLMASDPEDLQGFGQNLAIDGNTLAISADSDGDRGFRAGAVYLFARVEPLLAVNGPCPGELRVSLIGATPLGEVVLLAARQEGATPIPSGPCAGTEVGLADPVVLFSGPATSAGDLDLTREVGDGVCDGLLQVVDLETCALSPVIGAR